MLSKWCTIVEAIVKSLLFLFFRKEESLFLPEEKNQKTFDYLVGYIFG